MKTILNFIDETFIQKVIEDNNRMMYSNVWRSNLGWQEEIISSCGTVLIRSLDDLDKSIICDALERHGLISSKAKIELDAQAYLWNRLSFIPWHSDKDQYDTVRYAATLYLNHEWKDDWGGLFLYKMNDNIFAEAPLFNKLVFNDNNFPHATSMLSTDAPLRQTIQLFWKNL
jgi:Rps23 Pro-64 3,4-dihydroxylase Tpa1-like proline 4-hydroxylase